ncbi:c-type cytochrome [Blattabacterium cuenoti]|uniref:c-type cytochrome n=1 Tax=Blattabacterium cuenoti TaxID=1653831 RepID=UPI00163BDA47|nr:cytochrome c [Blattabacterium cuenoti]
MKNFNRFTKIIFTIVIVIIILYCNLLRRKKIIHTTPNIVYMPDMYYSYAYEPYSDPYFHEENKKIKIPIFLKGNTSSLFPVKNTIPRIGNFYEKISYTISEKGFNYSKKIKNSPIIRTKKLIKEGKNIYKINCSICHGDTGNGKGILVKKEKILGVPDYKDRELSIGSVYYVVTHGKNNMNSYSSQLNKIDRWKVSEYVMYLKNK